MSQNGSNKNQNLTWGASSLSFGEGWGEAIVTDMDGKPNQYFLYTPWGEAIKQEKVATNTWSSPYKFNGKELDEETGLYYYGARYYNPQVSVWLSVDAMASKYPNSFAPLARICNPCFSQRRLVYI